MALKPLGDRVIVKADEAEAQTASGLYLASEAKEKPTTGVVIAVGEGKLDIRTCSKHWEGLNSCSILEPMVKLYRLTGEKRYLEFAEYIISTGFIQSANLVELAFADEVTPHEYPIVKA